MSRKVKLGVEFVVESEAEIAKRSAGDFGKIQKSAANYHHPHEQTLSEITRKCGNCLNLIPERPRADEYPNCKVVVGPINRSYVCRYFERG